jgi:glycosyltransferase involved in cell wall biosynthesis
LKIALVVPGGVDASGERRVIPALLALIARLSGQHELHVFALSQQPAAASWQLLGAQVHNIGAGHTVRRAIAAVVAEHRRGAFGVIQSLWSSSPGVVAVGAARWLRVPSAVHVTGGELLALAGIAYGGRLTLRGRVRERLVLRGAGRVIGTSAPVVQRIAQLGIRAERIPLGVDLAAWPVRAPRRHEPGTPARLVHVASLNPVKDQTSLLRALVLLRESGQAFSMDIVGEDTLGGRLQLLAGQLGLATALRFRGFLTQRELYPVVAAADLMLVSSLHEAGPFSVLEAAVLGVPTVGTAVGHIAEWERLKAARAVPPADPQALAAATAAVLGDEEARLQLAHRAQALAVAEDADFTAARYEALYRELRGG